MLIIDPQYQFQGINFVLCFFEQPVLNKVGNTGG